MSWPYPQFEPQITYLPRTSSWVCLVRPLPDGEFTSLDRPGASLHPTPDAALASAVTSVQALLQAREEALAVEALTLLTATPPRLKPATIPNPEGGNNQAPLKYWQAQEEDGTWTEPLPTVFEAVKVARGKTREKAAKKK